MLQRVAVCCRYKLTPQSPTIGDLMQNCDLVTIKDADIFIHVSMYVCMWKGMYVYVCMFVCVCLCVRLPVVWSVV